MFAFIKVSFLYQQNPKFGVQLRVEAFCHPTEDLNQVMRALAELTPAKPAVTRIKGQFGEDMAILIVNSKGKEAEQLWKRLKPLADEPDDDGNSYIRLDKQFLLTGELKKGQSVKVMVKP